MELQALKCSFMSHKSDGWFANGQKSSLSNDDDAAGARVQISQGHNFCSSRDDNLQMWYTMS